MDKGTPGNTDGKLSRREILTLGGLALGAVSATPASEPRGMPPSPRPNFVIFMTEGQRPDEFSISRNPIIRTPNMDRIASEGMRFENAFVVNALCAPSRATMLTGLYSRRNGVIDNKSRSIASAVPIFPELLRQAGYEVAFCGKSHIAGALRNYYWDYYFGYQMQKPFFNAPIAEGINGKVGPDVVREGYSDDILTNAAAGWLEGVREKPFCLFLWLKAPHEPFLPPRHLATLYDDGTKIPKPATFDEDLKGYPGKPPAFSHCDNKIGTDSTGVGTLEQLVKMHYASTVGADENLGRILHVLERTGKLQDTVVIMTSDHGYFLGEWHFMDKRLMHEPSIRIPLMIRYPQLIKPGSRNDKMVLNLDVAPTLLDLAGIEAPASMQGRSLLPYLRGEEPARPWREDWLYAFYEYPGANMVPKNRGIRTERYKLIEYWEQNPPQYELYDLQDDSGELNNLYGKPEFASLTTQLLHRLRELQDETGEL